MSAPATDDALSWREELAGRGIIRDDADPVFSDPGSAPYLSLRLAFMRGGESAAATP